MKLKNVIILFTVFLNITTNSCIPLFAGQQQVQEQASSQKSREESPTSRFISFYPYERIKSVLYNYDLTDKDDSLFKKIIKKENSSFIGYHASSTDFAIFQDIVKFSIEEIMGISIPKDFHFFRNPLDSNLIYETADEFNAAIPIPLVGSDDLPWIRQHILSLNISLFQSFDAPWDLTPRYYLQNKTWTKPAYEALLKSFFYEIGLNPDSVSTIYTKASNNLSQERGILYQFFIKDEDYTALNTYFYVANSGGPPILYLSPTDVLFDYNRYTFPQLRMILNAKTSLNPYSKFIMCRYDNLTSSERKKYESTIRQELKKLPVESYKLLNAKIKLLEKWTL
jgi:hypothetical protein